MKTRMMMSSAAALLAATVATAGFADGSATSNQNALSDSEGAASVTTNAAGDSVSADVGNGEVGTGAVESTGTDASPVVNATPAPSTDTGATESTGTAAYPEMSYGSVVSGMQTEADFSTQVTGMSDGAEVNLVRLSDLGEPGENAAALDTALEQDADAIGAGREAVSANAQINDMLTAEGYTADDVIAVQTDAEGGVWVIVDDRA